MPMTLTPREMAPPSFRRWMEAEPDARNLLEAEIQQWLESLEESEKLFSEHVYDAEEVTEFDIRQHRIRLHSLLALGDNLFLKAESSRLRGELHAALDVVEGKMKSLMQTLWDWYGPMVVPEALEQAFSEVKTGKLESFGFAL